MFGLSLSSDFPEHEFVKKIQDGKKREMTVTKTFVTLIVEQYKFQKRRFIGNLEIHTSLLSVTRKNILIDIITSIS